MRPPSNWSLPSGLLALSLDILLQQVGLSCALRTMWLATQMLKHSAMQHRVAFRQYDQSSQCTSFRDSSVSYAAAVVDAV